MEYVFRSLGLAPGESREKTYSNFPVRELPLPWKYFTLLGGAQEFIFGSLGLAPGESRRQINSCALLRRFAPRKYILRSLGLAPMQLCKHFYEIIYFD